MKQYIIDEKKLIELLMKSYLFDSIVDSNSNINIKGFSLKKMTNVVFNILNKYEEDSIVNRLP